MMNIHDLTHDDCLAHATLADHLGQGLHPWVTLDDELQQIAHELLALDPDSGEGHRCLAQQPDIFARWLAREQLALDAAAELAVEALPGLTPDVGQS